MLDRREITHNIELLLETLPLRLSGPLTQSEQKEHLIEIVLDLGRLPEARFRRDQSFLSEFEVTREDLEFVTGRIGQFGEDIALVFRAPCTASRPFATAPAR